MEEGDIKGICQISGKAKAKFSSTSLPVAVFVVLLDLSWSAGGERQKGHC